ncbi:septin-2-like isoform X2 [Symsagittifera roscoffensis]|uniref:septin-2-like isoform X2 n=1 Tax=Symsagittifera roscoffensis TaxID=84072 RepID=UPI00307BFEED
MSPAAENEPGVGFSNLPNQYHRKSVKKGFEFTLMVVGESGLGKSTLISSLFRKTELIKQRSTNGKTDKIPETVQIETKSVLIEEKAVKLRLTVVDTPGFGDMLNNTDCYKTISKYIDERFEQYLKDESGLNRRNITDTRVHCCFYFINPSAHGLRPIDVEFMKNLCDKVNIVPVIAKSDTLTTAEVAAMKKQLLHEIEEHGIRVYRIPDAESDEDEEYIAQNKELQMSTPFAVVGSNMEVEASGGKMVRGRKYPWGVVDLDNPAHCDFRKLQAMIITHMQDMQEVTHEVHYESFRARKLSHPTSELSSSPAVYKLTRFSQDEKKLAEKDKMLVEKENELKRMQEKLAKMQQEVEDAKRSTSSLASVGSVGGTGGSSATAAPAPPNTAPPPIPNTKPMGSGYPSSMNYASSYNRSALGGGMASSLGAKTSSNK